MTPEENYLEINRKSWNNKTSIHLRSEFYDLEGFLKGKSSLNDIELTMLGDVRGKSILHLQCHFGQDTISLSRLGADVTGVDLSDKAIEQAEQIARETRSDARFICCDIYELPNQHNQQYDIVYTSYGVIGWLPDLDKWAGVISKFLKPGGRLVFVEFHPVVWMFDDDFEGIKYSYFNSGAIVETASGTYADKTADLHQQYVMWNHSLSDILNAILKHGMDLNILDELDYSPYNCFNKTTEIAPGKYRIQHLGDKIPMIFSILATKRKDVL